MSSNTEQRPTVAERSTKLRRRDLLDDATAKALTVEHGKRLQVRVGGARGLYLRVTADCKTFTLIYRRPDGQWRRFTLGRYPDDLTVKSAREEAERLLGQVRCGEDPQAERVAARQAVRAGLPPGERTVSDLARAYIKARTDDDALSPRTATEYQRMVSVYLAEGLGTALASQVRRPDVREFLQAVKEKRGPVMANRLFQLVRAVFRWGLEEEYIEANPCFKVKRPAKEAARERVLSDDEVKALWLALDGEPPAVATCVRTLALLAQRSGETLAMRWADLALDGDAPLWTIPGQFRKGGRLHVVPLAPQVVRLLKGLREVTGGAERVFDSASAHNWMRWWKPLHDRALSIAQAAGAQAQPFTRHDLRRTCATGCRRLGAATDTVSRILGHATVQGVVPVTLTYDRYSGAAEVRAALERWADHVERLTGQPRRAKVVRMPRRARA